MATSVTAACLCNSLFDADDGQMSTTTAVEERFGHWAFRDIPLRNNFVHFPEVMTPPKRNKTEPPFGTRGTSDTTSDADDTPMAEQCPDTDSDWEGDGITTTVGIDDGRLTPTQDSQHFCDGSGLSVNVTAAVQQQEHVPQFPDGGLIVIQRNTFLDLVDCPQPCARRTETAPPPVTSHLLESDTESILESIDEDSIDSETECPKRRLWADEFDELPAIQCDTAVHSLNLVALDAHPMSIPKEDSTSNFASHPAKLTYLSPKQPTTDGNELPPTLKQVFNEDTGVVKYQWKIPVKEFNSTNTQKHSPKFDVSFEEDVSCQIGLHPTESNWRKSNGQGRVSLKVQAAESVRFRFSVGCQELTAVGNDFATNSQSTCADAFNFKSAADGPDVFITLEVLPSDWQ